MASLWARVTRVPVSSLSRATVARGVGRTTARQWLSTATAVQESSHDASLEFAKQEPELPEFSSLKQVVSDQTLKAIVDKPFNLTHMSPVQAAVLPLLPGLSQPHDAKSDKPRDLLVRAKTGTGKTLAFLVPAIEARVRALEAYGKQAVADAGEPTDRYTQERAIRRMARSEVGCVIISPTRELATQIANEALRLSSHHFGFEVRLFVGGNSKRMQLRDWHKGRRDIVVGTPGRIRDLMENEPDVRKGLEKANMLILDEADTLLDMGFRDDLDAIISALPKSPERQTFMFSATVSPQIRQITRTYLDNNHTYINCVDDSAPPTHVSIPQFHTVLPTEGDQLPHLLRLLAHDQLTHGNKSKVIMFTPTTKMTQLYATLFRNLHSTLPADRATRVFEIHSKLTQGARDKSATMFREQSNSPSVLVTSDVSARGLDYPGVTRVIQVGIPSSPESYVHRAGRTGRGKDVGTGRVDLVLMPWEVGYVTWQLTDMPLKPQTTTELEKQVGELAQRFDSGELPLVLDHAQRPYTPALEGMTDAVKQLQTKLDEAAITDTMLSLFGYYGSRAGELRVQRSAIVDGLKNWTTLAMGLPEPPYISKTTLDRMGMARPPPRPRSASRQSDQPPWMRGNQGSRDEWRGYDRAPRSFDGASRSYDRESRGFSGGSRGYDRESRGFDRGSRDDRQPRSFDKGSRDDWKPRSFDRGSRDDRPPRSFDGGSRGYDRQPRSFDKEPRGYEKQSRAYDRRPPSGDGYTPSESSD